LIPLVLDEHGSGALVDALAEIVGNPVALADRMFHLIACSPREEHGDRHRRESIAHGGTPRRVLDDPRTGAYFRSVAEEKRPVLFPGFPEHGMDHRRLMAPIVAGAEVLGFLTVLEERPFDDALLSLVRQAAMIFALQMTKQRVALETELHLMADFLGDLLFGRSADRDAIVNRAGFLGVDLFRPWVLLLVEADDTAALCEACRVANPVLALQELFAVVRRRVLQSPRGGIVVIQGQSVAILAPATSDGKAPHDQARELVRAIRHEIARTLPNVTVSIASGGVCSGIDAFPVRYAEARRALDVVRSLGRADQTVTLEELGLYGILFRREDQTELRRFAHRMVDPLLAYDARRGTDLVGTLDAYLDGSGALRKTARRLGIHLNTLRGRLERIGQLCGIDLDDATTRLNLQLALKIARLTDDAPPPRER
jgi:sugar diacid utilization regulator